MNDNTNDPTEGIRRIEVAVLNATASPERQETEAQHGQCWDTTELQRDFTVTGFLAPYVVVTRKSDGVKGTLQFQHSPRLYFNWSAE